MVRSKDNVSDSSTTAHLFTIAWSPVSCPLERPKFKGLAQRKREAPSRKAGMNHSSSSFPEWIWQMPRKHLQELVLAYYRHLEVNPLYSVNSCRHVQCSLPHDARNPNASRRSSSPHPERANTMELFTVCASSESTWHRKHSYQHWLKHLSMQCPKTSLTRFTFDS